MKAEINPTQPELGLNGDEEMSLSHAPAPHTNSESFLVRYGHVAAGGMVTRWFRFLNGPVYQDKTDQEAIRPIITLEDEVVSPDVTGAITRDVLNYLKSVRPRLFESDSEKMQNWVNEEERPLGRHRKWPTASN